MLQKIPSRVVANDFYERSRISAYLLGNKEPARAMAMPLNEGDSATMPVDEEPAPAPTSE
mgnify:CR=1 FL=1